MNASISYETYKIHINIFVITVKNTRCILKILFFKITEKKSNQFYYLCIKKWKIKTETSLNCLNRARNTSVFT